MVERTRHDRLKSVPMKRHHLLRQLADFVGARRSNRGLLGERLARRAVDERGSGHEHAGVEACAMHGVQDVSRAERIHLERARRA